MEQWTIQRLLNWITEFFTQKGIDSPRLSAELLLSHVLSMKRIELYMHFDRQTEPRQLEQLRGLVKRCGQHEPLAYLIGSTEFYSLHIKVTPDCLIPRPETELLVEKAVEFLRTRSTSRLVCDLCTGPGSIAVAIAKNSPDCRVTATDISDKALAVAAENVRTHNLSERVTLLCGDLFAPLISGIDRSDFDLIVSNPPYISDAEFEKLDRNVRDYEPVQALSGGADGLDIYRRIADGVDKFLRPGGVLLLEIGYAQGPAVRELLEQTALFSVIKVDKDLHNNDRVVTAVKIDMEKE